MKLSSRAAEQIVSSASDAMLVVAGSGRILLVNPQAEHLFGYRRDELIGEPVEVLLPDAARADHERFREHYRGRPHARPLVSGLDIRGRRKNGETFEAEVSLTPIEDEGELLIASTIRDVSEREPSEAYFRQLLKLAPDAMIILDDEGRISIVSDQVEKMFGYSREELTGRPIEILLPARLRQRHREHREGFAREPKVRPMGIGLDLRARRKDGSEFAVEISLSPIQSASGNFVSSVIRDVSDRKQMEAELIAARKEAERAHKANTAFLAAASHDLRQPVQALRLLNGALKRTVTDELAREMIDSQQYSLDAMSNLLNSLLDISRLDSGTIEADIEEFPVRRLVDRLSAEFARQARQKRLVFVTEPNGTIIRSDPNLLAEIIQNLVSNAIRYTEQGQVSLTLRIVGDMLSIDVCDTGIGIPGDQLDEIFKEFRQIERPGAASEGFGLGLAIVRRLADLLDHRIEVSSELGKGSCFSVIVPIVEFGEEEHVAVPDNKRARASGDGNVVLVIEDDIQVSSAWSLLLKSDGYHVVTADSADAAVAASQNLEAPPAVIISDYHLRGEQNGVDAVEAVRAHVGRDMPAFIVSGDTSSVVDDAKRLNNCVLMSKPVHSEELLALTQSSAKSGRVPET